MRKKCLKFLGAPGFYRTWVLEFTESLMLTQAVSLCWTHLYKLGSGH